jgi:hypothetical protein
MASAISPEGEALLRWKANLLNSASLSSWKPENPTCSWFGVTCDDAKHVTELYLANARLNGTLGAFSFAVFQQLATLDFSNNNFFGAIPANTVAQPHHSGLQQQQFFWAQFQQTYLSCSTSLFWTSATTILPVSSPINSASSQRLPS